MFAVLAQWLRQIDSDQNDTRRVYPVAREGSSISILGRERWNIFERAPLAADRLTGSAGVMHD